MEDEVTTIVCKCFFCFGPPSSDHRSFFLFC